MKTTQTAINIHSLIILSESATKS